MIPHDRRGAKRFDTANLVTHTDAEGGPHAPPLGLGVTLDLNEFGLRIQQREPFVVGDRYRFHIALGDDLIAVVGRVAHVAQALNGTFETGVEFLEASQAATVAIRRHCLAREKRPPS